MKEKIQQIQEQLAKDENFQRSLASLKPTKSIWGFLGIILFFFVPEIVGVFWGQDIIDWSHAQALQEPMWIVRKMYEKIESAYIDGISYFNLILGGLFLYWLWKD
jgi:Zn-dependent protease with chaperone function